MAKQTYRIRDPVHGFIELSDREIRLINTKVFQRLRRIRQLEMAFLVYPGTLHTRFDHSIGVMHIAGRICTELKKTGSGKVTNTDVKQVRFAALLHDVGHGPFSHVSEDLLAKGEFGENNEGETRQKIHEQITVDIVRGDPEINAILSGRERDFVVDMIQGKEASDWRRDVISSELDADKMDYLLRDSYFAGVKYGEYDLEKLIESCRIDVKQAETSLAISSEGIYALEQLLLARYHMTQQVYWHRVCLISRQMIVRGVTLAIEAGNVKMKKLYQYDPKVKKDFIQNYLNYHDEKVIDILKTCDEKKAREIFNRLYNRNLFKMVAQLPLKDEKNGPARKRLIEMKVNQKRQWEQEIAKHLSVDADDVIVHKLQIPTPNYGDRSNSLDPRTITIFDERQKESRDLNSYPSELPFVRPRTSTISLDIVQVYAPCDNWYMLNEQYRLDLEAEIQNILRSV